MQFIDYCKLINQNDLILVQNINLEIHGKTLPVIEYIYFVIRKVRITIQQILILNEIMDSVTLEGSTQILDLMNMHFDSYNKNLNQISYGLFEIFSDSKELTKEFDINYKSYAREYHHSARRRNLNKIRNK